MLSIRITLASLATAAFCAAQDVSAMEPPSDYEKASHSMRRYCMADLCVGMTMAEVKRTGHLVIITKDDPNAQLTCDLDGPKMTIGTHYFAPNNTRLRLTFDLVTARGNPETNYRLHGIAAEVPNGTPALMANLLGMMTERFKATTLKPDMAVRPATAAEPFDLYLSLTAPGQMGRGSNPAVLLMAAYKRQKEWLMSLPECQTGVPKL